ncbi:anti-sigma factor [Rhizobium sp. 2MFCol3.1]|uniref:anti-sigma factor n=1 Tax=Rhizobium sp. 2MFCol3.1 TaxID=1246459 RepID=UPI00037A4B60|nr:anti-sigma factor [Rhizobium sp. 2MFCol3.1]
MTPIGQNEGGRPKDEILAGEYVLGVLSADARRMVERRIAEDRAFATMIERWQSDLSTFNDDYQETTPGAAVFTEIEKRLFGVDPSPVATGLWNAAGFWRWVSLATSAVAVVALVYASGMLSMQPSLGPVVAELSAPDNPVNLLASFDASSGRLRIIPVAAGKQDEKSLQLWLVPGRGNPRSLGVFQPNAEGELLIPADLRQNISAGATLAVSLEPFGGSPTGLPTGPVVASGTARQL